MNAACVESRVRRFAQRVPLATLRLAQSECTDGNRSRKLYMRNARRSWKRKSEEREKERSTGSVCENVTARRMRMNRRSKQILFDGKKIEAVTRTIENKEDKQRK